MGSILGLDYGEKRVGLALASEEAVLARPYRTLPNDEHLVEALSAIVKSEGVVRLVVGLPRGLDGQETAQTARTRAFAANLADLQLPITLQDEATTSELAHRELEARGKTYSKGDVDSLAATFILEDYLNQQRNNR